MQGDKKSKRERAQETADDNKTMQKKKKKTKKAKQGKEWRKCSIKSFWHITVTVV